ncbi:PrsW family glutamic-type intramembrane protease [Treponema sp. Marseille-Q4132]|uniref:PrsW family glutamic-type intramembrane protease n=1 Tax=Treponema sp. Marseille-Q4132 TaxID=2766701 RepID=UPI0016533EDC|nr:PrsW family glutamic-type intramembrane protease [Treponema sp. Marseille-Q4132]QNL96496.1 PrsW family intramembrane metalloprotease [Treponema sp. Marseille-Q4132]
MNIYAALALCFVPLIIIFFFVRRFAQTGIILCLYAVLLGLLAVAPISILQFYAADIPFLNSDHWITQLLRAVLFNGLIEEFIKIIFMLFLPSKRLSLGKFFLCACICGMSLGCFESAIYFLQHLQQANTIGAHLIYAQIFTRMFTSDAVHTLCAGLGALFIRSIKRMRIDIAAVLFAPLIHGLYDFFALYDDFKWFSAAAILFLAVQCRIGYTSQAEEKSAGEKIAEKTEIKRTTKNKIEGEKSQKSSKGAAGTGKIPKEKKAAGKSIKQEKKESLKKDTKRKSDTKQLKIRQIEHNAD